MENNNGWPEKMEHKNYCQTFDEHGKQRSVVSGEQIITICDCGARQANNMRDAFMKVINEHNLGALVNEGTACKADSDNLSNPLNHPNSKPSQPQQTSCNNSSGGKINVPQMAITSKPSQPELVALDRAKLEDVVAEHVWEPSIRWKICDSISSTFGTPKGTVGGLDENSIPTYEESRRLIDNEKFCKDNGHTQIEEEKPTPLHRFVYENEPCGKIKEGFFRKCLYEMLVYVIEQFSQPSSKMSEGPSVEEIVRVMTDNWATCDDEKNCQWCGICAHKTAQAIHNLLKDKRSSK